MLLAPFRVDRRKTGRLDRRGLESSLLVLSFSDSGSFTPVRSSSHSGSLVPTYGMCSSACFWCSPRGMGEVMKSSGSTTSQSLKGSMQVPSFRFGETGTARPVGSSPTEPELCYDWEWPTGFQEDRGGPTWGRGGDHSRCGRPTDRQEFQRSLE